jgi:WD40 repeat protein
VKYDAFISYSHAVDSRLAPAIQSALHRFAKPWYRLRILHLFRDQTSLALTPELWGSIQAALSESRHFLLCASPEAAQSAWVRKEVEWWLGHRDSRTLFVLLTSGDIAWDAAAGDFDWKRTTALPDSLRGAFVEEPLYVDLRFARRADDLSLRNPPFREAILDIAAPLHGRSKDELGGADVREHRRTVRIAAAAVAGLAILLVAAVITAWIAIVQRDLSRSRELAALARNQLEIDPAVSLELAADAMQVRSTTEARQMLRTALLRSHLRRRLQGHTGEITLIDVAPSGDRAVSAGLDGRMLVWDLARARVRHALEGYRGAVSADFERAVSSVSGHRLAVWDLTNGQRLRTLDGAPGTVFAVALSPDGRLAASGDRDGTVQIHDVASGRIVVGRISAGGIVTDLVFAPDGRSLAIGAIYNRIVVWDVEGNERRFETRGISAAFSPDGDLLVTSGADNSGGRIVDAHTGRPIAAIGEMPGSTEPVRFTADGERFAAASSDGSARVWRRDGSLVAVLSGHETWVEDVAFSPNGRFVATASRDQTARVWSVASGREIATLRGHLAEVTIVRFSPDGRSIVTGANDGSLRVWDVGMASPQRLLSGPLGAVQQLGFSADGRYIVAARDTGETVIVDGEQQRQIRVPGTVFALGAHAVVTADEEYVLRRWNFDGTMQGEIGRHTEIVSSLTMSPDGRYVVSTSEDRSAIIVDLESLVARSVTHDDGLSSAAFNTDGSLLATADYAGTTKLWRFPSLEPLVALVASDEIVSKVAFTRTGDRVVTGSWDGTIRVWDSATGMERRSLTTGLGDVYTFVLFADDTRLIAGGSNGSIELWNLATGQRLTQYRGHSDGIYQISLSPTAPLAASASNDGSARLWDLETGEQIAAFAAHSGPVWSVAFSPDGESIVTGSEDGDAHVYACLVCAGDDALMRLAQERLGEEPPDTPERSRVTAP